MGDRNPSGLRKVKRGNKTRLIIDFPYTNEDGKRVRFRRDASVQTYSAALAEAKRLMQRAAETGCPEEALDVQPAATKPVVTFADYVSGPFEQQFLPTLRPATSERYRALSRQRLLGFFGPKPIDAIELADIRAFAATVAKDGIMLKGPVALVCTILRTAYELGFRGEPPKLPRGFLKTSKKLPDAPSPAEVVEMLKTPGWVGLAIALAALAGMRMGEVRGVEVRDIDFDGHRILIRRAMSADVSLTPKSGHERVVPMVPELEERLREAVRMKLPKARVVVMDNGETPGRTYMLTCYKKALAKAGLKERSFHSLRHYFITELVRRGVGLEAVRTLAGHSKLDMTQRYAHATADDLRAAIDKLAK